MLGDLAVKKCFCGHIVFLGIFISVQLLVCLVNIYGYNAYNALYIFIHAHYLCYLINIFLAC